MGNPFPSAEAYANEPARHPPLVVVDVAAEQRAVADDYRNVVLSRVNGAGPAGCLRLAVFRGEYRWHHHPTSDELFLVVEGRLEIDLADRATADRATADGATADGATLALGPWQAVVVPAGVVHRTRAVGRTVNLTFEALGAETVFVD